MKVKFWGVRGSIPSPGPDTAVYGGNTSCIQLILHDDKFLILDCGSGIRALGKNIIANYSGKKIKSNILLSHTHWDHIQGFPFFEPAFIEGNEFIIYGPSLVNKRLEDTLAGQMEYRYFPVKLTDMRSGIIIKELNDLETVIDGVKVESRYLYHTSPTLGFKITHNNKIFVYCTDNEAHNAVNADKKDYQNNLTENDQNFIEFLKDADLLVHDSQYTPEEYLQKIGWGHSSWKYSVQIAKEANVKKLVLFHHDPEHSDKFMEKILSESQNYAQEIYYDGQIFLAQEGKIIEV